MKRIFCTTLCLLFLSPWCLAQPTRQQDAISIGKLRFGIHDQEMLIRQSKEQEQQVRGDLTRLTHEVQSHQEKIETLKAKIGQQQQILKAKEQEMISLMRQNESLRSSLIKRLKAYYLSGQQGLFTYAFSGQTLPEMLISQEAFASLVTYDQELFSEYRASITEIKRVTEAKSLEKAMLEKFLEDTDQETQELKATVKQKDALMERVRAQKGLYVLALREMRKAERELADSLQHHQPQLTVALQGSFLENKGLLPPPLWGEVVRGFHQSGENGETTFANGITIKTPAKSEVFAIFGGTILFAGPMRGYGKMIIIDHHQQYYSVSARLGEISVQVGDTVSQGQLLGRTNAESYRPAGEFYFEIRRDALAENPLHWLSPESLSLP
nr:peptidoglycan DD-metalloendopeptidase family protein [uncultured Desulfobulbus sp.]